MTLGLELVTAILGIVVIDLVLSGDNAVVIGIAAHRLPSRQRRLAILVGGAGAVIARVTFTAAAALLLALPLLRLVGGAILLWIAFKLLEEEEEEIEGIKAGLNLREAIRTIILADVAMSLDNILAVGAASHGDLWLLLFGLSLSIPILMFGSGMVAAVTDRVPVLVYVGSAILAWVATGMIVEEPILSHVIGESVVVIYGVPALLTVLTLAAAHWFHRVRPFRQARERVAKR